MKRLCSIQQQRCKQDDVSRINVFLLIRYKLLQADAFSVLREEREVDVDEGENAVDGYGEH